MLFAGGDMERKVCSDAGDERKAILAVVVWKMKWSWWCGRYGEQGAI